MKPINRHIFSLEGFRRVFSARNASAHKGFAWSSTHIRFSQKSDELVDDEVLLPLLTRAVSHLEQFDASGLYFFVRYWREKPELRLRVSCSNNSKASSQVLQAVAREAEQLLPGQIFDILPVRYRPEMERYGGKKHLGCAQLHFYLSSELAFHLLEARANTGLKFHYAFLAAIVVSLVFMQDFRQADESLKRLRNGMIAEVALDSGQEYAALFLAHCDEVWESNRHSALQTVALIGADGTVAPSAPKWLRTWSEGCMLIRDLYGLECSEMRSLGRKLIPSLNHMTFNRIGIPREMEAVVLHTAVQAMAHLHP